MDAREKSKRNQKRRRTAMKQRRPDFAIVDQVMAGLNPRDYQLVRRLSQRTYLRTDQIHRLLYADTMTLRRCGVHLYELAAKGVIASVHVWDGVSGRSRKWAYWHLDVLGWMIATDNMEARPDPYRIAGSSRYARHYGAVSEVWLRLLAAERPFLWIDGVRYETSVGTLEPDGVIVRDGVHVAIEVDMGSEWAKHLTDKLAKYTDLHGDPGGVGQSSAPALLLVSTDEARAARLRDMADRRGMPALSVTFEQVEAGLTALPEMVSDWRKQSQHRIETAMRRRQLKALWERYDQDRQGWERRRDAYVARHSGLLTTQAGLERKFAELEAPPTPPDESRPVDSNHQ